MTLLAGLLILALVGGLAFWNLASRVEDLEKRRRGPYSGDWT